LDSILWRGLIRGRIVPPQLLHHSQRVITGGEAMPGQPAADHRASAAFPKADRDGYVESLEANLLPGVRRDQFEGDLCAGAGCELTRKFRAIHSSSALAVNTFAPFKDHPENLVLGGQRGFTCLAFEKQLPTGLRGTPPTLDVFLCRGGDDIIAIESKFLEYFTPKRAYFAPSYSRGALPLIEDCWWNVLTEAQHAPERHLDVAQLVKHYLGIARLLSEGDAAGWKPTNAQLLYLYWEPVTPTDTCLHHRADLQWLASKVIDSCVEFRSMSYLELWHAWEQEPALRV